MKRFVITGCARSGTGYTARLLTALGAETAHESVFSPYSEGFDGWAEAPGESSWLAAPFLDQLPAGTVVLHQLRHPQAVVQSLLALRFFDDAGSSTGRDLRSLGQVVRARGVGGVARRIASGGWRGRGRRLRSDFVAFAVRHAPDVLTVDGATARSVRYWIDWNGLVRARAAEAAVTYVRYRLEDVDSSLVGALLDHIEHPAPQARIEQALAGLPTDTNTRVPASRPDPVEITPELVAAAREYGYRLDV